VSPSVFLESVARVGIWISARRDTMRLTRRCSASSQEPFVHGRTTTVREHWRPVLRRMLSISGWECPANLGSAVCSSAGRRLVVR
jgi:hypothetical protein